MHNDDDDTKYWYNISNYGRLYPEYSSMTQVNQVINLTAETAQSLIGSGSTTDYYRLPE